jgi:hypothetical protein
VLLPLESPLLVDCSIVLVVSCDASYRATVLCIIQDLDAENHANIKFLVELGDGEFDEIIVYGILCIMHRRP